jgi:predicted transcriptional regulator
MKCLKVTEPFASLIVAGDKTWEIRRRPLTGIRGEIAIGSIDRKEVVGYVTVADAWACAVETLKKHNEFHFANKILDAYANGKTHLFVWYLQKARVEPNPYPYSYSTGSWCKAEKPSFVNAETNNKANPK